MIGLLAQTPANGTPTSTYFLVAMVALIAFVMLRFQRQARAQREAGAGWGGERGREVFKTIEPASRSASLVDLEQWEVRMHDLARELSGQLESKMGLLDQLIRDADRAAGRLEAAVVAARRAGQPADGAEQAVSLPARTQDVPGSQADSLRAAAAVTPSEAEPTEGSPPPVPDRSERRYDEIYLLADYGFSREDISARSGLPLGEVELILRLRQQRR